MGWGTDFKADLYLNRQIYDSMGQLDDAISDAEERIEKIKQRLFMFASASPKEITSPEWDGNSIDYIHYEFDISLDELLSETKELQLLWLYKEYLEEQERNNTENANLEENK